MVLFAGVRVGKYRSFDPALLPPLLVAWLVDEPESSGLVHTDLRARWTTDPQVRTAMERQASSARELARRLASGRGSRPMSTTELGAYLDRGMALRRELVELHPAHAGLVDAIAAHGLSVNYTGSGGAAVATWAGDRSTLDLVRAAVGALGGEVAVLE